MEQMNKTKWNSLEDEVYRVYVFPNNEQVKIENPHSLFVSKSGGHRIIDMKMKGHYIPSGWIHIFWEPREGKQTFAF